MVTYYAIPRVQVTFTLPDEPTIGAGSATAIQNNNAYVPANDDTFNGSTLTFTSGVNIGLSRAITDFAVIGTPAIATFTCAAFPAAYTAGDTFTVSTVCDGLISGNVELVENNYWTAQLNFRNSPAIYPSLADVNTAVLIEARDEAVGGVYTTLFVGTILYPDFSFNSSATQVGFQCVGLGYALNMMNVAEEYGSQSRNPAEVTLSDALTDGTVGIIPKWVNHYKATANDSGYNITSTYVANIIGNMPYISFPWKPANKCLDDLCDLNTALSAGTSTALVSVGAGSTTDVSTAGYFDSPIGSYVVFTSGANNGESRLVTSWASAGGPPVTTFTCDAFTNAYTAGDTFNIYTPAGPHWIVDHSGNLRVKRINSGQSGWTHYYGDSSAAATLVNGEDFFDGDFQPVGKEANIILYYGKWQRPSSGDFSEGNASDFGTTGGTYTWADDAVNHISGAYGVKCTNTILGGVGFQYPVTQDAAWDFSQFQEFNTPSIEFSLLLSRLMDAATGDFFIKLYTAGVGGGCFYTYPGATIIDKTGEFKHFSFPIGPFAGINNFQWKTTGTPLWSQIDYVDIFIPYNDTGYAVLDGLHFVGADVCRVARQEFPAEGGTLGESVNPMRFKVITDNVGKDDSLTAVDDSGLMAQLAKAELIRTSKETVNGKFSTPLIADVLPGQFLSIGQDWRITKVTHNLSSMRTSFEVTDDVTNSHTRLRYEDINKQYAAIRPEYQDRQATSVKSGSMDIRVLPLEKAYDI
jgi:hypothetical protein